MRKFILLIFFSVFLQAFSQEFLEITVTDSSQLKLTSLKIDVKIIGNYASTTYDMKFYNELNRTLEGELVFPLGEGQTVSRFAMDVNDKLREAVIVEKEVARVAFETTVRQTIDPGLLEKTEGNNYKARVYPILPKKHKHVVLTFEQELSTKNGLKTYELPLGLKEMLDTFSIHIEVFNAAGLPKIKTEAYSNFFFKEKDKAYQADLKRQDHRPSTPVIVQLQSSDQGGEVLVHGDYFHINQALQPATRLKDKPKKITLLWDTSYSLRNRNLIKELSILNAYFDYLKDVEIQYVSFSNAVLRNTTFHIQDGNWNELKRTLEEADYDGGTAMNLFDSFDIRSDEILLFTDGLANLGDFSAPNKRPVYTINSTTSAHHELLEEIATSSGGNYINLVRLPQTEAIRTLKQQTFQFLGTRHDGSVYEVYPKQKTNVSEDFSISGKFSEETTIELLFGYGRKVTDCITVPIKKSERSDLVKRLWAKLKLKHLNTNKKKNKEQIVTLAKSHYLVTDYTSMLILDRIEDYVRYRIEPPQELKTEYKERLKNLAEEEANKRAILNDRKADLFDDYQDLLKWYNSSFPKKIAIREKQDTTDTSPRISIAIDSVGNRVSGTVLDAEGEPLPGVTVAVKDRVNGTVTDFDGNFSIDAEENDELSFSYVGFTTTSVVVGNTDTISIEMEEDDAQLEEVVVTALGTRTQRHVVGYVVNDITSEELEYSDDENVAKALAGQVSGVQITQNSGAVGSGSAVVVRGLSSLSGDGNPLYVVDGVPVNGNPVQELKPEDIENIQVLKAMSATALYGSRGAGGVIIITTKQGMDTNREVIEELDRNIKDKIELKSWNPDTPYIKVLEKEPTTESAYRKYFEIRDDYANSPSFYLDVADFFDKKGKSVLAIRILTNLIEVELNNHEIMRALGYKLEYFKQYELAVQVYGKVLELRPEEPQSYRDLALAYEQAGEVKKAYELLHRLYAGDLLEKDGGERFSGIEQIAYVELSRIVSKYEKQLKPNRVEKEKLKEIPVDVRIVIDWNHNDTDIDLWVEDPAGEKAYYKNPKTAIGGRMSEDMTQGYGPEEFMLKNALRGDYKVLVDYYADSVQKISGPTVLKVTMFTNYGRTNEERKTIVVRLDKEEDELEVGSLRF